MEQPCFSSHIFLFPFSLKGCGKYNKIISQLTTMEWRRNQFKYTNGDYAKNFNLQSYFYEFSIGALLDDASDNCIIESYVKNISQGASYNISVRENKSRPRKYYELNIKKITLSFYNEKVGILGFHLDNQRYTEIEDILLINDSGRRIYPFYLSLDNDEVCLADVKKNMLADSIEVSLGKGKDSFKENFSSYNIKKEHPFNLPIYISGLLPSCMKNVHWLLDDRMYVICWYGNDIWSKKLKLKFESQILEDAFEKQNSSFTDYNTWSNFVHIHKEHDNKTRFINRILKSTYDRLLERNCLYGISRHSLVALTDDSGWGKSRLYLLSMYYHMASLCLAQRTMLMYYKNAVSDITKRICNKGNNKIFEDVKKLNLDFITFMNSIYFREVTAQSQGKELYEIMQKQMEIEIDVKELKSEIEQLYQYTNMSGDQKRNEEAQTLNFLAAIILPLTVITGIFGMNDYDDIRNNPGTLTELGIGAILCLITILVYIIINKKWNKH